MEREVIMSTRLDPQIKELIEQQAKAEDRKPSAMLRVLAREALRARGLLRADESPAKLTQPIGAAQN